jgi:3-oxoacyl-[acyl-carrier protein] reductase
VALVTDGSGGIGAATVRSLAAAGWDIGFSYRCDEEAARQVEKDASELGARVAAARTDLAGTAEGTEWVRRAEDELGPARALVICAGIARDRPLALLPEADWRAVIGTGLEDVARAALAVMVGRRSGSGLIVAVSSACRVYHRVPEQDHPAAGPDIAALTRALARRGARFGIRVNAVVPSAAEPDLTAILPGRTRAALTQTVALRRFGHAADVAGLIRYLLSEEAPPLTGRVLAAGD